MHLVCVNTPLAYSYAVALRDAGNDVLTFGLHIPTDPTIQHFFLEIADSSDCLTMIKQLISIVHGTETEPVKPENKNHVESVIFFPSPTADVDRNLIDIHAMYSGVSRVMLGPYMAFHYLQMFDLLDKSCRLLFVQSIAQFDQNKIPGMLGNYSIPGLVTLLKNTYEHIRPNDVYARYELSPTDVPGDPNVVRLIERFILSENSQAMYHGSELK